MSRGFVPGLYVCAFMLALSPDAAFAQAGDSPHTTQSSVAPSAAEDNEARELFRIGKEAFDEARFERALKYFNEAYELSHRAALLSNIGTALDRLRRDQEAVDAYRKYLEQVPDAGNRRLIEERIRIIEAALARAQPAPPAGADPTPSMTSASPQPPAATPDQTQEAPAPLALTPQRAALAAASTDGPRVGHSDQPLTDASPSPITSRWWFWTGIGAVAVAAVVVVVAVSAAGSSNKASQRPTLLDPMTRVREL